MHDSTCCSTQPITETRVRVTVAKPPGRPSGGKRTRLQEACQSARVPCRGWQVALHIARGLHHMHSRKVMHLDLKSANILLARDGTAKVADVGLAKILTRDNTHVSMEGTFDWAAPEVGLLSGLTTLGLPSKKCA